MNRLGIIGYPLGHTLSPAMQTAGLEALGLTGWSYEPVETPHDRLDDTIRELKESFRGFNVTIPYKEKIIPWLDEVDQFARVAGAVNTVKVEDGRLLGTNTDGRGFLRSLEEMNFSAAGAKVLVLGSGGAARGVATALVLSGATQVDISSRKKDRGSRLTAILRALKAESSWTELKNLARRDVASYQLVVQTTPVGMHPHDRETLEFPFDKLKAGQLVADVIYRPETTRFLELAGKQGARTLGGFGMLLYQGALALEYWTGQVAPVAAMEEALRRSLDGE